MLSTDNIVIPIQEDSHGLSTPFSPLPSQNPSPLSTDAIIHHDDNTQVSFYQTFFLIIVIDLVSLQIITVLLSHCIQVNVFICRKLKRKVLGYGIIFRTLYIWLYLEFLG